jgi:hypothetical protein
VVNRSQIPKSKREKRLWDDIRTFSVEGGEELDKEVFTRKLRALMEKDYKTANASEKWMMQYEVDEDEEDYEEDYYSFIIE